MGEAPQSVETLTCKQCLSENLGQFNGEVAIHFPGLEGLNKPIVWVFPKLLVCLSCGFTDFAVPDKELRVLVQGAPVEGALALFPTVKRTEKAG